MLDEIWQVYFSKVLGKPPYHRFSYGIVLHSHQQCTKAPISRPQQHSNTDCTEGPDRRVREETSKQFQLAATGGFSVRS